MDTFTIWYVVGKKGQNACSKGVLIESLFILTLTAKKENRCNPKEALQDANPVVFYFAELLQPGSNRIPAIKTVFLFHWVGSVSL